MLHSKWSFWLFIVLSVLLIVLNIFVMPILYSSIAPRATDEFRSYSFLLYVVILFFWLRAASNKALVKIVNACYETCDVEKYLELLTKRFRKNTLLIQAYLVSGYFHIGDYDRAISLARQALTSHKNKKKYYDFSLHSCLFSCFLMQNRLVEAEQELTFMHMLLSQSSYADSGAYIRYRYLYDIAQGNTTGALRYLKFALSAEQTKLGAVALNYRIAQVCVQKDKIDAARKAATFVIENGNKTIYVPLAKQLLADIG